MIEKGYKVSILCWDRDPKAPFQENIDGIYVERIYVKSTHGRGSTQIIFLLLFWIKALIKALSKKIDITYCHDFDTLPLGYTISRLKKTKLVYDAHESYVDMLANNVSPLIKKIISVAENYLLKKVDLTITVGDILKESLIKKGAFQVMVVGNWKQLTDFQFSAKVLEEEKTKLGIPKDALVVSYIAHLNPERKIEPLLRSIENEEDVFLVVGGRGPIEKIVRNSAQKHKNIIFLGFVHPLKVPFYVALSDVVYYGFDKNNPNAQYSAPNKLFEALAAGKAIITGDFGEIGHIVKKYNCGLILKDYSIEEIKKAINILKNKNY
ncbi:MAG: glycosyltransferase, partial [Candidatus Desulfofervidus sp.]|nr:glycosyltransferase [Candidatus Desulfofervidus sp.]